MNKIEIFNQTNKEIKELDIILDLMNYACSVKNIDNVMFNIIIVDNDEIHKINKEYRNIDRPTDVITFALEDDDTFKLDIDTRILGDIYISIDKCISQSIEYGHSFKRELAFLAVHGFLHLLGYDHTLGEKEEKEMFDLQELILDGFKIKR
ncbi:MAG: rRNA maturation RNase YbeY [Bacilli bacterium]|nr:rRNA maturation RNase YbeY [Bacilli bacterium]